MFSTPCLSSSTITTNMMMNLPNLLILMMKIFQCLTLIFIMMTTVLTHPQGIASHLKNQVCIQFHTSHTLIHGHGVESLLILTTHGTQTISSLHNRSSRVTSFLKAGHIGRTTSYQKNGHNCFGLRDIHQLEETHTIRYQSQPLCFRMMNSMNHLITQIKVQIGHLVIQSGQNLHTQCSLKMLISILGTMILTLTLCQGSQTPLMNRIQQKKIQRALRIQSKAHPSQTTLAICGIQYAQLH